MLACVCVRTHVLVDVWMNVCVCVCVRERESMYTFVCVGARVCMWAYAFCFVLLCLCVCASVRWWRPWCRPCCVRVPTSTQLTRCASFACLGGSARDTKDVCSYRKTHPTLHGSLCVCSDACLYFLACTHTHTCCTMSVSISTYAHTTCQLAHFHVLIYACQDM